MKKYGLLIFIFINASFNLSARVYTDLPVKNQIIMILTSLRYNETFLPGIKNNVKIGVYVQPNKTSAKYSESFFDVFQSEFSDKTFYNKKIDVIKISSLDELLKEDIHVLIITPDVDRDLKELLKITGERHIVSATGCSNYINSGISIVVGLRNNKSFLAINIDSAQKEKSKFSAKLLQLAKIVKNENE